MVISHAFEECVSTQLYSSQQSGTAISSLDMPVDVRLCEVFKGHEYYFYIPVLKVVLHRHLISSCNCFLLTLATSVISL